MNGKWIVLILLFPMSSVSAETIHGCVNQKSGKLRIVGTLGQCKDGKEAVISWNSAGPEGPQGPQGPNGDPGEAAADPTPVVLVGFTSQTTPGDAGALGMTKLCAAEFTGSRFCTSKEVLLTADVPDDLTDNAWVRPSPMPVSHSRASPGVTTRLLDASGVETDPEFMTCEAWRATTKSGLSLDSDGRFSTTSCTESLRVSCCAEGTE